MANKDKAKTEKDDVLQDDAGQENSEVSMANDADDAAEADDALADETPEGDVSENDDMSDDSDSEPVEDQADQDGETDDLPDPNDDEIESLDEDSASDDAESDESNDEIEPDESHDEHDQSDVEDLSTEEEPVVEDVVEEKVVERIVEKKGGFMPALLGGVAAAIIGFIAGRGEMLDQFFPVSDNQVETQVSGLSDAMGSLGETVAGLSSQVTGLQDAQSADGDAFAALQGQLDDLSVPDLSGVEGSIAEINASVTAVSATLDDLGTRLSELEKRPIAENVSEEAIAAYERELSALQSTISDQQSAVEAAIAEQREEVAAFLAEAKAAEATADEAARSAQVQTHIAEVLAAIDSGEPFPDAVAALNSLGVTVDPALADVGAEGVSTLVSLQGDLVPLARAALASAREADSASQGIGSFLQRQLGARSVTPQEGDSPNAVLSRIEAAVGAGDLDTALQEADTLPGAAKADLADWLSAAQARQAATQAASALIENTSSQ